jgi:CBS domain-containing protein
VETEPLVADVMLRSPKTLAAYAPVSEVRRLLENPSVQMVLLVHGERLAGVITEVPADAPDDGQAVDFAELQPETIGPAESAAIAFKRTSASPNRRLVVVDAQGNLVGLLCLNVNRTRFCGVNVDATAP